MWLTVILLTSVLGAQNNISPAEMNQVLATIAMEVKLEWWEPAVKGEDQVYVLSSDDKVPLGYCGY